MLAWLQMQLIIIASLRLFGDVNIPLLFVCDDGSYLVDKIYKKPVIIYEHPKEVKPFYMHVRDDGKTVSSFDIIAPKVSFSWRLRF